MRRLSLAPALVLVACAQDVAPADKHEPRRHAPHSVVDMEVTWPSTPLDRQALAGLSTEAADQVARATVPALVVKRQGLLNATKVVVKPRFFALSARHDGIIVSLHATATAHRYRHVAPARGSARVRNHAAFVTANEAIWSAAWVENGVAYSLEMECAALPDPRCDDASSLMDLTTALAYVGGLGANR